ncbi:MAG: acetylornithine/succinylornithine family transaminase [Methermicoccaceae archaeon]
MTKEGNQEGNHKLDEIMEIESEYVMPTYARQKVAFVRGRGALLYDTEGKEYIDMVAGIAVAVIGHSHPKLVEAICSQAKELIHTSNIYYIPPQAMLARRLCEKASMDKVFFCNSGAEAVEAAMKLARKHTKRTKFVACEKSFHGRTFGSLSVTYKQAARQPFEPLLDTMFIPPNDMDALKSVIGKQTAAFIVEPVQGEGGVVPTNTEFLRCARDLCDDTGTMLIFDEVQTGMGRTGKWFAKEHSGVEPDAMCLGKAIAGGLPMGALLSKEEFVFEKGEHGSTFGGGFVTSAAALATIDIIESEGLVERSEVLGTFLREELSTIKQIMGMDVEDVRGIGLMVGMELSGGCDEVVTRALDAGILINCTEDKVLRFIPPLVIEKEQLGHVIKFLRGLESA